MSEPSRFRTSSTPRSLYSLAAIVLARVLVQMRKEAGLTQRQLAGRLGWPHGVIGIIESGQRHVRAIEIIAIAQALGRNPATLIRRVVREMQARQGTLQRCR